MARNPRHRSPAASRQRSTSAPARRDQNPANATGEQSHQPHPLRFYRVGRLAELFGVCRETIWRWEQNGVLPPFRRVGSLRGLTEQQVQQVLEQRGRR